MAVPAVEIERVQRLTVVEKPRTIGDKVLVRIVPDKKHKKEFGHLISKIIAKRKSERSLPGYPDEIGDIARSLQKYEGILPDPFNNARRLSVTRLIATIDRGVYNY